MNDEQKNLELLKKAFLEGDSWLREQGVVTDMTHNTIVTNVYVLYDSVQYVDYVMDKNNKIIDLTLYIGFWRLLFMTILRRRDRLLAEVFILVQDYLKDFQVRVKLKRYKPGVEQANPLKPLEESPLDTEQ